MALVDALDGCAGALLGHELRAVPGIVVYSHMAGQTAQARRAAGIEGAREVLAALAGSPKHAVNAHLIDLIEKRKQ